MDQIEEEAELRSAVQYAAIQIIQQMDNQNVDHDVVLLHDSSRSNGTTTTHKTGYQDGDGSDRVETTPHATAALSELAFLYATQTLSRDLVAFANHAGRKTVTDADVLLVARKNPLLHQKLLDHVQNSKRKKPENQKKKRAKPINLQKDNNNDDGDDENSSLDDDTTTSSSSEMIGIENEVDHTAKSKVRNMSLDLLADSSDDEVLFGKTDRS